jgi:hypothetical protein
VDDRLARELLRGAVSFHDHYGWEHGSGGGTQEPTVRRMYDPVAIARSAADAGLRAVLLRNLYFTSCGDAELVQRAVPEIEVYGGIFIAAEIGGINPIAIDTAMSYGGGAKFVCMATESSAHEARLVGVSEDEIHSDPIRFITPFDRAGNIKPEMSEVLAIIASHDVIFETGSLAPAEILTMVQAAKEAGITRIVVTHPTPYFCRMSVPDMQKAISMGALIEFTWMFYTHSMSYWAKRYFTGRPGELPVVEPVGAAFDQIRELGAGNCILDTTFGSLDLPLSVEGLREFVFCMLDLGMAADEITAMIRDNPTRLLGLATTAATPSPPSE